MPIHFELKSEFEKRAILNAYKAFLKSCSFDMQIIIQSNQEDLTEMISALEEQKRKEKGFNNMFMVNILNQYITFIQEKNKEKGSSLKSFYLIIGSNEIPQNQIEKTKEELHEKYIKIKDTLSRCGNKVEEVKKKEEVMKIIKSFFYQEGSDFFENSFSNKKGK